ncbi:MAG TPA: VWA domain-containing protein [Thermoanaerobaculia bacterium]|nr:VWA domain-containing protein [Thermoanaerobaculia bacterium]
MKPRHWFASALLVLAVSAAFAQRISESMQVTVIEVPVTVVDRAGNAVRGLTKEDFEVTDDGKRVPIDYFEMIDLRAIPADKKDAPPAAHRNFLLLFDLANSSPEAIVRAARAAQEFVEKHMEPRDLAAVAVFSVEGGARMITSFTTDRYVLRAAISTLGNPKYFKVADPLMISIASPGVDRGTGETGGVAGEKGSSLISSVVLEELKQQNALSERTQVAEQRSRLKLQLKHFGNVARMLDKLQGQKQIILLSEGFDPSVVTGRTSLTREETQETTDQILGGEAYNVDSDKIFGSTQSTTDIGEMAALFRRSDVRLHAIDIAGVRSGVDAREGAKKKSNEGLHLVTRPTGGTVFENANDLGEGFDRMLKQQEVIYVLGFNAGNTGKPGKFHDLKVKTRAKGARVAARAGYYEPTNKMSDLERALTLAEMLMIDAPMKDVDVRLAATTLPGPGGKSRVPVVVEIPGEKLLGGLTSGAANANLYVYAFDPEAKVADFLQQRVSLDLAKAGETIRKSGVRYFGTLRLPPGNYSVKALVRVEETGKIGLVRSDVTVPQFDTATVLPPVFFADPAGWAMLLGPSRGDDYAYPFAAGDARYVPLSHPSVKTGADYNVALFLYRVPLENLGVTPTIVSGDNEQPAAASVKLLGRTSADDRGGVKLLFRFRPEGLPAGEHQLRFTVKASDGTERVVSLPFTIL